MNPLQLLALVGAKCYLGWVLLVVPETEFDRPGPNTVWAEALMDNPALGTFYKQ